MLRQYAAALAVHAQTASALHAPIPKRTPRLRDFTTAELAQRPWCVQLTTACDEQHQRGSTERGRHDPDR